MKKKLSRATWLISALLAGSSFIGVGQVFAQDQVQTQVQIYGSQLMTAAERTEYQTKMRSLKTDTARDAFRLDHHTKMTARAAERGITLPTTPPGVGAGSKSNTGLGVGPGSICTTRVVAGGGSAGNPVAFGNFGSTTMTLKLREADTGASRSFGTATHAWIVFSMI